ncbi:MAG TPA: PEP-CTERM sorting domain-containing protein [Methylophilaceae bacterium]|jgi:hypothetical protein|nr:PEP-CTERM sorting domain-containing protein [Methylophilaceae bacterium]
MNFKMKALVAAVALTASMSASAAMTNSGSGDSSLILTLLDNQNNISAAFDLGMSYSTFQAPAVTASGTTFTWDLANNANYSAAWDNFLTVASGLTGDHWAVFAGDNLGTGAGAKGMVVSYASGTSLFTSELASGLGLFDGYINANNSIGNHSAVADGSSSATAGNAFAESAAAYGTNGKIAGKGQIVTWGLFDQSLNVASFTSSASVGTQAVRVDYANAAGAATFTMSSNGVLTYAAPTISAVPEADSWAMLLAGLGLMGFIARRRTAA